MNFKKKHNRRVLKRKEIGNSARIIHEWSRMLHLWWKRDLLDKKNKNA